MQGRFGVNSSAESIESQGEDEESPVGSTDTEGSGVLLVEENFRYLSSRASF